ncbi:MAG: redoxin [Bacteroides sp. SM23_62]|nr:MAG: redoxin [Bacteroides sp. SM23_62]
MKKIFLLGTFAFLAFSLVLGAGYKVGDKAEDFKLQNVDGKYVSLADFDDAKGFIVVFTCNGCPYAKAYQDRLIALDKNYKAKGYPVVAINPNDVDLKSEDNIEGMKKRAEEKGFTFPYLKDARYEVFKTYGATRTPHIYVLQKDRGDLIVKYIGAIDDNYQDASAVEQAYLANAVDALLAGKNPDPNSTKAIGCTIKQK